jgi:methylphosphotriester-DNA--protein-cysteine methyltransferase
VEEKKPMEEIIEYWTEEAEFLSDIIRKCERAKDEIHANNYESAISTLDEIINRAKKKLEEVV